MKVALCLSGQIRSFDLVYQKLLDNLIIPNNCDVFYHTWHSYNESKYVNYYNPEDNMCVHYGAYSNKNLEKVIKHLKPVSFSFEEPFIPQNTKSMFYSLMKSNDLKCNYERMMGFKYDIVIRSRSDILFLEKVILDKNSVEDNIIYLSYRPGGCGGVNDAFAYGKSDIMDRYSNIYEEQKDTDRIYQTCPEGLIYNFLLKTDIKIKKPPFAYSMLRENGDEIGLNPFHQFTYEGLGFVLANPDPIYESNLDVNLRSKFL